MFVENNAEYVSLRNSGRLGIIRDPALRSRIVAHYESRRFIHSLHETDCENNVAVFNLMAPFVSIDALEEVLPPGEPAFDGFEDSSRPRVASVVDPSGLLRGVEFGAQLTNLVSHRQFLLSQIIVQKDASEALREELLARIR